MLQTRKSRRPAILLVGLLLLTSCGDGGEDAVPEPGVSLGTSPLLQPDKAVGPVVSFSQVPAPGTSDGYVTFAFAASEPGSLECTVDDEPFRPCTSPHVVLPEPGNDDRLSVGPHSFQVRALSAGGVQGPTARHDFSVTSNFRAGTALATTGVMPAAATTGGWRGIFRINCDLSHSSYNDPVVYPGQENRAHLHNFYGNMAVDHATTLNSLFTTGDVSCQGGNLNRSGYWVPALLAPGVSEAQPWQIVSAKVGNDDVAHEVFYYSAGVSDIRQIRPVPFGLRMIAGTAGTQPGSVQPTGVARWHCLSWESSDGTNPRWSSTIPECAIPDQVRFDIFFPSCWNGRDLDSADHKSHMAYPVANTGSTSLACPASHPVAIARVSYHYAFPVLPGNADRLTRTSRGWRLASDNYTVTSGQGGGLSLHGDWFNGWHPEIMEALVANCIRGGRDCHDGNLANGWRLGATRPGSQNIPTIINAGLGQHAGH